MNGHNLLLLILTLAIVAWYSYSIVVGGGSNSALGK